MKSSFLQDFNSAFWAWANHFIADKAETVSLKTGQVLYKQEDDRISGYYSYNSRYKPWCADLSLIPNTPSGFNTISGFVTGLIVDYQNGRILSQNNLGNTITGNFYAQEVGIYLDSSSEEQILFENKYVDNARFYEVTGTGINPYVYKTPAIFLSTDNFENKPFAFGGEDSTEIYAKAILVCENDYERDTLLSVLNDASRTNITNITSAEFPFNEFFDITGAYNYENHGSLTSDDNYFIEKVVSSRLSRSVQSQMPQYLSVGFVDFTICKIRYPRA